MKLQDFLKTSLVRCVNNNGRRLTVGKIYNILSIIVPLQKIEVENDTGANVEYDIYCFEPITNLSKSEQEIDTSANSVDNCQAPHLSSSSNDDAPHVEPKFKVGDKVYLPSLEKICTIDERERVITSDGNYYCDLSDDDCFAFVCATAENHALLSQLYPHINFEAPLLTGGDLVEAMLKKGIKNVLCLDKHGNKHVITNKAGIMFVDMDGFNSCGDLTPIDWVTDEPLTEAVLDE